MIKRAEDKVVAKAKKESADEVSSLREKLDQLLNTPVTDEEKETIKAELETLKPERERLQTELQRVQNRMKGVEKERDDQLTARKAAEKRFDDSLVTRSLMDAALPKAKNAEAARILTDRLFSIATLQEDKSVTIKMKIAKDGVTSEQDVTPQEAVEYIEGNNVDLAFLFSSQSAGGLGGLDLGGKDIDISKMSMSDYAALVKDNPAAVGLTRKPLQTSK
jgi:hypothetical protein